MMTLIFNQISYNLREFPLLFSFKMRRRKKREQKNPQRFSMSITIIIGWWNSIMKCGWDIAHTKEEGKLLLCDMWHRKMLHDGYEKIWKFATVARHVANDTATCDITKGATNIVRNVRTTWKFLSTLIHFPALSCKEGKFEEGMKCLFPTIVVGMQHHWK